MADNDEVNDEYQFTELDPLNPNVVEEEQGSPDAKETLGKKRVLGENGNNVKRNAIIAVIAFVGLMLGYKFLGSYFLGTKDGVSEIKPAISVPSPAPIEPAPVLESVPPAPTPDLSTPQPNAEINSNLSSLALGQENLNSQVATFGGQIDSLNSNMDRLTAKITELNGVVTSLSDKLDSQSQTIARLSAKPVATVVRHPARSARRIMRYYIQAVIPGRAWLVAANGSTLTVREGSDILGYGRVKLIDPNQGRVMTSSGQVIRFSQSDS